MHSNFWIWRSGIDRERTTLDAAFSQGKAGHGKGKGTNKHDEGDDEGNTRNTSGDHDREVITQSIRSGSNLRRAWQSAEETCSGLENNWKGRHASAGLQKAGQPLPGGTRAPIATASHGVQARRDRAHIVIFQ